MIKIITWSALLIALSTTTGCSSRWLPPFYKLDMRQGNYVDEEIIAQLRPGMTKNQVQFLMGSPLIVDPFHPERWDYFYSFSKAGEQKERYRISLFFQNDLLARIDKDLGSPQ